MNEDVKPPRDASGRIGFTLSQLGADAARRFAELIRPLGVTPAGAGVLRVLARTPGISQRELADRLGAGPSRVVVLVDALQGAGLVARTRDEADRRTQRLALTVAGRDALRSLRTASEQLETDLTAPLDEADRVALARLLARLLTGLGLDRDVHGGYADPAPPLEV